MNRRIDLKVAFSIGVIALLAAWIVLSRSEKKTYIDRVAAAPLADVDMPEPEQKIAPLPHKNLSPLDLRRTYDIARNCVTYIQFGALMERKKNDPEFALNNPRAMGMLSAPEQERLIRYRSIAQEGRMDCEVYNEPSYSGSLMKIYDVSSQLAASGDLDAATCFVEAPWGTPVDPSPEFEALRQLYEDNARKFAEFGISHGNWRSAIAAFDAAQAEHGIRASIKYSIPEKYSLARLLQMGSIDSDMNSRYGYDAAMLARTMTAAELVRADARASEMYSVYFQRKAIPESALLQNCGV